MEKKKKKSRNFYKMALKRLCYSQLSDSLAAVDTYQVCIADISLASRMHQCDVAMQGNCGCWASSEAVNYKRGDCLQQ